ncbi:hypothetical protein SMAC4_13000 [Sordaria macrospora]|uniref:uncharacterized protein n=1 Tax=Sordaria macrospora TaxID=5147 RepID=UPI002B2ABAB3|nr:hypothetical protein SMAC4_13000 [Sordaria macrospora]
MYLPIGTRHPCISTCTNPTNDLDNIVLLATLVFQIFQANGASLHPKQITESGHCLRKGIAIKPWRLDSRINLQYPIPIILLNAIFESLAHRSSPTTPVFDPRCRPIPQSSDPCRVQSTTDRSF